MSGKIRQSLGLTKRRLEDALKVYGNIKDELELQPEQLDDEHLYELFETSGENFEKLRKLVQRLETLDKQWSVLMETDPAEIQLRAQYIAQYGDYAKSLDLGRSAVDHLRRRVLRLRDAAATRLDLGEFQDDPVSEGTLTNLPKEDELFYRRDRPQDVSGATTPLTMETGTQQTPIMPQPVSTETVVEPHARTNWADMLFLPPVNIPKFNGNPSRWNEFNDMFRAMVDTRDLEPCVKLFQLRSHLEGEAKESLAHLGSSNADYLIAMNTLTHLYGDPLRVTHRLRSEIIHLKINEKGATSMYKGWSRLNQLYAQLVSMGDKADTTMLAQIIEAKFPRYILQKVYRGSKQILSGQDMLDAIGEVLRKESNLDRIMADNRASFNVYGLKDKRPDQHKRKNQVFTHFNKGQVKNESVICHLCDRPHPTYKCDKYTEPRSRQKQALFKKLCLNCLKPGHFVSDCGSKSTCKHCQMKHNSLICFKNDPSDETKSSKRFDSNHKPRVTFKTHQTSGRQKSSKLNSKPRSSAKEQTTAIINEDVDEELTEEAHTHASSTNLDGQAVLLMTTAVNVSRHKEPKTSLKTTLFLDKGSTKSYITENLANLLKLKPQAVETLRINVFGNKTIERKAKVYSLDLRNPLYPRSKPVTIKATALPQLTCKMNVCDPEDAMSTKISVTKEVPQILIGMDQHHKVTSLESPIVLPSGFNLVQSPIGTFVYGTGGIKKTNDYELLETYHSYITPTVENTVSSNGSIKLILGPMWSGKTTRLLNELDDLYVSEKVILITHTDNKRYCDDTCESPHVVTHEGDTASCLNSRTLKELETQISDAQYIFIDEVHFFHDSVDVLHEAACKGKIIVATGIHSDSNMEPLSHMSHLIAKADEIVILRGTCENCQETASFTHRKVPPPENLFDVKEWVGGTDKYSTLCRFCMETRIMESVCSSLEEQSIVDGSNEAQTFMSHVEVIEEDSLEIKQGSQKTTIDRLDPLQRDLTRFWALEHLGIMDDAIRNDDDIAMEAFLRTIRRDEEGRYICSWPWKTSNNTLPSNFGRCLGRLRSTLKRLRNDPDPQLITKYDTIFKEQLAQGIIEEVKLNQRDGHIHYIPHQAVITPQKTTTRIRIVFDASCKTSNGRSLNDYLFRGPVLLPDLVGMLLRFRAAPIPILADVEKAFLQLTLNLSDRDCTRFLWAKNLNELPEGDNLVVYRFARVPFGVNSSPFLLAGTVDYHLQHYPHPLAKQMRRNSYVDNLLIIASTPQEASQAYYTSKQIFKEAQMNLREYQSSHPLVKEFLSHHGETTPDIVKVLGIPWDTNEDTVTLVSFKIPAKNYLVTKRIVLKIIASLFDPLGLAAPMMTQAKLLIQRLWKNDKKWDELLEEEDLAEWERILSELKLMKIPTIPRLICPKRPAKTQLHVFSDASTEAYASVAYLRSEHSTGIEVSFLMGKARIKPIKEITIPRLELLGIYIAATLAHNICKEMEDLRPTEVYIWTDSMIALSWVHSQRTLPVFVKNRVNDIWRKVPKAQIKYVSTKQNPADVATRKLTSKEFEKSTWVTGPNWLLQNPENWPTQPHQLPNQPETLTAVAHSNNEGKMEPLLSFERFSKWTKAINTLTCVMRFINMKVLKRSEKGRQKLSKLVDTYSSNNATQQFGTSEMIAFRLIQQMEQPDKKRIKELSLILDDQQIYRCKSRMTHSALHPEAKEPIYLPTKNYGTKLYVLHIHRLLLHASPSTTVSTLRMRTWIPQAKSLVSNVLKKICNCRKLRPFKLPEFPPYPSTRVMPKPPFHFVGLDYGGPFIAKLTKTETTKMWVCLFTCLTSRAVHLELVFDISTLSFLQALRRFISRRGAPTTIWSDNAPHFKTASQVLTNAWKESKETKNYLATRGIKWNWIVQGAPWQGGTWERAMGLIKTAVSKAIGARRVTMPEMFTLMTEIEAIVNSRPLTFVPSDESYQIIRPIDCISPGAQLGVPILDDWEPDDGTYESVPSTTTKVVDLWRKQQVTLNRFWDIWSRDYLTQLSERLQKDHKQDRSAITRGPIPNEVVYIHDDEATIRGDWRLAKVVEVVSPTKIKLQLANPPQKFTFRSPKHLYPLELDPSPPPLVDQNTAEPQPIPKRRSQRLRNKVKKVKTFFIELIGLLALTMLAQTSALPSTTTTDPKHSTTTVSNSETTTSQTCPADDCAPWRLQCCTSIQRTGMLVWIGIAISLIPALIILINLAITFAKIMSKLIFWTAGKICKRIFTTRPPQTETPNRRSRVQRLLKRTGYMAVVLIICLSLKQTSACSDIAHITADGSDCVLDDETMTETCRIHQTVQVSLRPVADTVCINITSSNNNSEVMEIVTKDISFICSEKLWYWTRDFDVDVEAVHRCRNADNSNCFKDWCENAAADTDYSELSKYVKRLPGYTHCTRSCQCATCNGCFLCEPSCLFWRLYAKPSETTPYVVTSCPTWYIEVIVEVHYNKQTETLKMQAGLRYPILGTKFTLQTVSTPQLPILSSPFIYNVRTNQSAAVDASAPGQPVAGSVGTLQCPDEQAAENFKCSFPREICSCTPSDFNVKCNCNYRNPRSSDIITGEDKKLPLTSGPVTIYQDKKRRYVALVKQQANLLLHVDLGEAKISILQHSTKCVISTPGVIEGCHSCNEGAIGKITCHSTLKTTLEIECDQHSHIQLPCDNTTQEFRIFTTDELYDKECSYQCSKTNGTFELKGKLHAVTVPPDTGHSDDVGHTWSKAATSVPFDKIIDDVLKFFGNVLGFFLKRPLLIILIVVGLLVAYCAFKAYLRYGAAGTPLTIAQMIPNIKPQPRRPPKAKRPPSKPIKLQQ